MARKKKLHIVIILPAILTVILIGGLLSFVLIMGSARRTSADNGSAPLADSVPPGPVVAPACDYPKWIGKPLDEAKVQRVGRPYRIIHRGDAVTQDYSATRINIELDSKGVVMAVHCG